MLSKKISGLSGVSLLLLRLALVSIFLFHGLPKALNWTMASEKFVNMGFAAFWGPVVGILEVAAAALILIGLWTTFASLILGVIIAVALIGVQIPGAMKAAEAAGQAFTLTAGLERDLLIFTGILVLMAFGAGALSVTGNSKE